MRLAGINHKLVSLAGAVPSLAETPPDKGIAADSRAGSLLGQALHWVGTTGDSRVRFHWQGSTRSGHGEEHSFSLVRTDFRLENRHSPGLPNRQSITTEYLWQVRVQHHRRLKRRQQNDHAQDRASGETYGAVPLVEG